MFANTLMKVWLVASCCVALVSGAGHGGESPFTSVEFTEGKEMNGTMLETMVTLADPAADGKDTITIKVTVPKLSWVAVGVNPDGTGMIGGEVVIGKPEDGSVLKYKMSAKAMNAISEQPNQTLLNTSIEQMDGSTVLTFTKLMVEEGEFSYNAGTVNTMLAAHGSSNTFGFHQGYGVQAVNLPSGEAPMPVESFVSQVNATGDYMTLLGLLENPQLQATLGEVSPITVFGPNDAAFAAVDLTNTSEADLLKVLGSHVAAGYYKAADVIAAGCVEINSLSGTKIRAMYVPEDVQAMAGHGGDAPTLISEPTGYVMINEAKVILADIHDDTNIFHGLDTVLLEEGPFECPQKTFVEQVAETGEYNTLVTFFTSDPTLETQLANAGALTVFGPNDAAFAKLDLTAYSETQQLQLLGNHVVSGVYTAADVKAAGCVILTGLFGGKIRAMYVESDHSSHSHLRRLASHGGDMDEHEDDHIMINEAMVILADVADGTSIFHGLDTVLTSTETFECPTDAPAETDAPAPTVTPVESGASMIGGSILFTAILSALALIW